MAFCLQMPSTIFQSVRCWYQSKFFLGTGVFWPKGQVFTSQSTIGTFLLGACLIHIPRKWLTFSPICDQSSASRIWYLVGSWDAVEQLLQQIIQNKFFRRSLSESEPLDLQRRPNFHKKPHQIATSRPEVRFCSSLEALLGLWGIMKGFEADKKSLSLCYFLGLILMDLIDPDTDWRLFGVIAV